MKYKIFISTAGRGTRMAGLDTINKSLLPINYEAVISKIIDKFPKHIEIIIAVGHEKEVVKNFIKIRHSDRKIKFIYVKKYYGTGSGPGYTLYECRKYLQCPFIYSACDTIVPEKVPEPKFNWIGVTKVESTERYLIIEKKKSDNSYILFDKKRKIEVNSKKKMFNAFVGLAGIRDYKSFWKGFENNKRLIHNELQFSNGLNYILPNSKLKYFTCLDTGTNESYIKVLNYFKDDVLRKPNACTYIGNGKVIKFFKDKSKVNKLKNRSRYLKNFCPKNAKTKANYFYYDYAKGSMLSEMKLNDFKYLINEMDKKFWKIEKNLNKKKFHSRCYDFYKNKTLNRINLLFDQKIINDDIKFINGHKTFKIHEILNKINWNILSKGIPSNFHGDFQPENIILNRNKITLIDWREDFSGSERIGDLYYDLAKLDHALVINGDVIRNKKYSVKIMNGKASYKFLQKKNLKSFRKYFHQYIKDKKYDLSRVKILSSLIYLNIAPLHEYPYNEFLFYHGKLNLTKNLIKLKNEKKRT
jgi:choline kinase